MRALINPLRDPAARYPTRRGEARALHRRLPGYEPTPLDELPRLAERLGVARLFVKDESRRFGLPAFKVLGASYALVREIERRLAERGAERSWATLDELGDHAREVGLERLVTATDGNHGRGVARVARWLGLDACVFMPGSTVPARSSAIESEGARVTVLEGAYDDAVRRAHLESARAGSLLVQDTAWPGYEAIPARIVEGYSTIMDEIDEALGAAREELGVVCMPVGVGSLADAMARHFRAEERRRVPRLASVEPEGSACLLAALEEDAIVALPRSRPTMMAGLDCGTVSTISWPVLRSSVDVAFAIGDDQVGPAMRALAEAGIESGESGAACLAALFALEKHEKRDFLHETLGFCRGARILIVSTEGATDPENYARVVEAGA